MRAGECGILNHKSELTRERVKKMAGEKVYICVYVCVHKSEYFLCASHGDHASELLFASLLVCALFLSAFLFVGSPSHLFQNHICDLMGSDWYGNIIIQARILSLPIADSVIPLTISFYFFQHWPNFNLRFASTSHFPHRSPSHRAAKSSPFLCLFNLTALS